MPDKTVVHPMDLMPKVRVQTALLWLSSHEAVMLIEFDLIECPCNAKQNSIDAICTVNMNM